MSYKVTYSLVKSAQTSARLSVNGKLVKALWSNKKRGGGKQSETISTEYIPAGKYSFDLLPAYDVRAIIMMQVGQYYSLTEPFRTYQIHRGRDFILSICYAQEAIFYANSSTENKASGNWFSVSNIHYQQTLLAPFETTGQVSFSCCTDGDTVWFLGAEGTIGGYDQDFIYAVDAATKAEKRLAKGVYYKGHMTQAYQSAFLMAKDGGGTSAGKQGCIAVQKRGMYLFVSDPYSNRIWIIHKSTFAFIGYKNNVVFPTSLAIDQDDQLWVAIGNGSAKRQLQKFDVDSKGNLTSKSSIALHFTCGGFSFDMHGNIEILDGTTHVIRKYSPSGNLLNAFGIPNGYANDATVADNKFLFLKREGITHLPDGTKWIVDYGNYRLLHVDANNKVLNRTGYLPGALECQLDGNNAFSQLFQYKLNFTTNTWLHERNYIAQVPAQYKAEPYFSLYKPTTRFGRRFCLLWNKDTQTFDEADITTPQLRFTGKKISQANGTALINQNLDIIRIEDSVDHRVMYIQRCTGLDKQNNPVRSAEVLLIESPQIPEGEVMQDSSQGGFNPDCVTADGTYVWFVSGVRGFNAKGFVPALGPHLKGYKNHTDWLWNAQYATAPTYYGPFREDDTFDIGQEIQYASTQIMVLGEWIVELYNGEFWRQIQTCIIKIFHQSGLMLGQFGVTKDAILRPGYSEQERLQFVGNPRIAGLTQAGNDLIIAMRGESPYDAICVFRYTNVFACRPLSVPVTISAITTSTARIPENQAINLLQDLKPGGVQVLKGDGKYLSWSPNQSAVFRLVSGKQSVPSDEVQSLDIFSEGYPEERSVKFTPPKKRVTAYAYYGTMDFHRLGWEGGNPSRINRLRLCDNKGVEKIVLRWQAYDSGELSQFVLHINNLPQLQYGRYGEQLLIRKKWALSFSTNKATFKLEGFQDVTIAKMGIADWLDSGYLEFYRANTPVNSNDTNIIMLNCFFDSSFPDDFFS